MPDSLTEDFLLYSPNPPLATMARWLEESNHVTRQILKNLPVADQLVPQRSNLNPPLWEFGHLTWFHEFWVHRDGQVNKPSLMNDADHLFNSSEIAHQDRWTIAMPSLESLLDYNQSVFESTQQLLRTSVNKKTAYFIQLAIFHQDMHNEAFAYMWQTMGYAMPFSPLIAARKPLDQAETWIHFSKSMVKAGSDSHSGFIFDNEKWNHALELAAFSISSKPVTNADFLQVLESEANSSALQPMASPSHWKKDQGVWFERFFDQWLPLNPASAVRHINHHDAQRYCDLKQVRLPNEYELSKLMSEAQVPWQPSYLWEWTSSTFAPFPGFSPDPYVDYSQPWFDGSYKVLKGGSSFTPDRLRRIAFRNFYQRDRSDHFCGFRTCLI